MLAGLASSTRPGAGVARCRLARAAWLALTDPMDLPMDPYYDTATAQLWHGDCLAVLPGLAAGSVDSAICSPPYAMQRAALYGGVPEAEYPAWTCAWMAAVRRVLKPRGSVLINIREHVKDGQISDYVHRTRLALRADGWIECDELIWIKPTAPPVGHPGRPRRSWERILWFSPSRQPWCDPKANGRASDQLGMSDSGSGADQWINGRAAEYSGIARSADYLALPICGATCGQGIDHPAAYPVELAAWMLRLVTPPGGVVFDPFTGSGSTGVAALENGCGFVGTEREGKYLPTARTRILAAQVAAGQRVPLDTARRPLQLGLALEGVA